jgi:hypothetical protein
MVRGRGQARKGSLPTGSDVDLARAGTEVLWDIHEHATLFIEPNVAQAGAGRITLAVGREKRDDAMRDGQILMQIGIQVTGRSSRGWGRSSA